MPFAGLRHDGAIARLLLLNGPPGIGKSTLARRYVDEHPRALLVEIDDLRARLGGWEDDGGTKLLARDLALALAASHLRAGYHVVLPQYLGRTEYIQALDHLASEVDATFHEVLLTDAPSTVAARFRDRREHLASSSEPHPQSEVGDAAVDETVAEAFTRLETVRSVRANTIVIDVRDGLDGAYCVLCRELTRAETTNS